MKDQVFNPNFLKPTVDNMKRVQKESGADGDSFNDTQNQRQITFYSSIVPSKPEQDTLAPYLIDTNPQVLGYLGNLFFTSTTTANRRIVVTFSETVINHDQTYNYEIKSASHMGTLAIERVNELSNENSSRTQVELILTGDMVSGGGLLEIEINPAGSKNKIQDSAGNETANEILSWYVDLIQPWIETVSPSPQGSALPTDTFDWTFLVEFSENLPASANSWGDVSHWNFELINSSDRSGAPISVAVTSVFAESEVAGSYSADAGSLRIQIETEDPFLKLSSSEAALYDLLRLTVTDPDESIVDRAGNSLQFKVSSYEWDLDYANSDTQGPTAVIVDPGEGYNRIPLVMDDGTSNTGSIAVGFDEVVVNGTDPNSWSVNDASGMVVNSVSQMGASQLTSYGVADGYILNIVGQSGTSANSLQLSTTVTDEAGNRTVSGTLTKAIERFYPRLSYGGSSQGLAQIGHGYSDDSEILIYFDTPVHIMPPVVLDTFWGVGNNLPVLVQGENSWEPSSVEVVLQSVEQITGLDPSNPEHILAHRILFQLQTAQGTPVPDGLEQYRVTLSPVVPSLIDGPSKVQLPLMPMGFPNGNDLTQNPDTYSGGFGNPLTASRNALVYDDDFENVVFFEVQNNREVTTPQLVSASPADGATIDPDLNTITLTFSESLSSDSPYGFLELLDDGGNPITLGSVVVSGADIVITLDDLLLPGNMSIRLEGVTDIQGDTNPERIAVQYTVDSFDHSFQVTSYTKNDDGTVTFNVSAGDDVASYNIDQIRIVEDGTVFGGGAGLTTGTLYERGNPPHSNNQGVTYVDQSWDASATTITATIGYPGEVYLVDFKAFNSNDTLVAADTVEVRIDLSVNAYFGYEFGWGTTDDGVDVWKPVRLHLILGLGSGFSYLDDSIVFQASPFPMTILPWDALVSSLPDTEVYVGDLNGTMSFPVIQLYSTSPVTTVQGLPTAAAADNVSAGFDFYSDTNNAYGAHLVFNLTGGAPNIYYLRRKWDESSSTFGNIKLGQVYQAFAEDVVTQYGRLVTFTISRDIGLPTGLSMSLEGGGSIPFYNSVDLPDNMRRYEYGPVYWENPADDNWMPSDWIDFSGTLTKLDLLVSYRGEISWAGDDGVSETKRFGFMLKDQRPHNVTFTQTDNTFTSTFSEPADAGFGTKVYDIGKRLPDGTFEIATSSTYNEVSGEWSTTNSAVTVEDGQTYVLRLTILDPTDSSISVWNSEYELVASLTETETYNIPAPVVTYNSSDTSHAEVFTLRDNHLQPYWGFTTVTRPGTEQNKYSVSFEFPDGDGYTIPTIHWEAKYVNTDDPVTTFANGVSTPTDSGGQLFEVSAPTPISEPIGVGQPKEFEFYVEYEGKVGDEVVVASQTTEQHLIDWQSPSYRYENAVSGLTVGWDPASNTFTEPETVERLENKPFYVSMWRSMSPSHQSYSAAFNKLRLGYQDLGAGINTDTPLLPPGSIKRVPWLTDNEQLNINDIGAAVFIRVTVVSSQFRFNGRPNLYIVPGVKYVFYQTLTSYNSHPFAFSTTGNGIHEGGEEYTTNVTVLDEVGSGTAAKRVLILDLPEDPPPPTLYYYCANHSAMGREGLAFLHARYYYTQVEFVGSDNNRSDATSLLAGEYAWEGDDFTLNLVDPRTFAGWDVWKYALNWSKIDDYSKSHLLIRNTAVTDVLGNGNADASELSKEWPWLRLVVDNNDLFHNRPLLVDVERNALTNNFGIWSSSADQSRFDGFIHVAAQSSQPVPSVFWDPSNSNWVYDYIRLAENDYDAQEWLSMEVTAGGMAYEATRLGLQTFEHMEVDESTVISFFLELHYLDGLEPGRLEVKLHGEHLSFLGKTTGIQAGNLEAYDYDGEEGNRLYGVPYPVKINHWSEMHNSLSNLPANMVGDGWRVNRHIVVPEAENEFYNSTAYWPYQETGSNDGVISGLTTWVDRGKFKSYGGVGLGRPLGSGRMVRVGLALTPWMPGRLSVQKIPGTEAFGIPLTLEVGRKPFKQFLSDGSDGYTTGADFISFWLVVSENYDASQLEGLGKYDFVEEAETVSATQFGPEGGHSVGTRGYWSSVVGPNQKYGRQVKHANHVVDLMSSTHGIAITRPAADMPSSPGAVQPPNDDSDPNSTYNG